MKAVQNAFAREIPSDDVRAEYFDPNPDLGGDRQRQALHDAVLEIADTQIREYPPATIAYERLISEGISDFDARRFIANLVARQIWLINKNQQPLDEGLYAEWLDNLPELPD